MIDAAAVAALRVLNAIRDNDPRALARVLDLVDATGRIVEAADRAEAAATE